MFPDNLVRPKYKSPKPEENIHTSLSFLIRLGNCFGLLPVNNNNEKSLLNLKFNWKSWKCIYTYIVITIFGLDTIMCFVRWAKTDSLFMDFVTQMANLNTLIILLLYLNLARNWSKLMEKWSQVDTAMRFSREKNESFQVRVKIFSIAFMLAALGQAGFYLAFSIVDIGEQGELLSLESLLNSAYPELTPILPSNLFTGFVILYYMFMNNIITVFNDLFIVILSTALALRFKQISDRLACHVKKLMMNDEFWVKIRADYDRVVQLSKKVDKNLSYIVLTSFSVNILWLLTKISTVVGQKQYSFQIFFHTYSFGVLIVRVTLVSLYAAWVNDESKEPMTFLNAVPSSTYNDEIQRFILQISFNDVAITGSKLFKVTRGLILSIAGAIVTYELVVIQFRNTLSTK